jgi:hypothetical protein
MTPQEKALDLIVKMENIEMILEDKGEFDYYPTIPGEVAKKAALICVDEIMKSGDDMYESEMVHFRETGHFEYWQQVKIELQNFYSDTSK